ncbi:MAG: hypothetical protein M1834_008923 [Cirrosporium novae-zelandiae]|nr:MAG: hypothetical protein M1834_008923 [Cirrosporium novae-zelandiae]
MQIEAGDNVILEHQDDVQCRSGSNTLLRDESLLKATPDLASKTQPDPSSTKKKLGSQNNGSTSEKRKELNRAFGREYYWGHREKVLAKSAAYYRRKRQRLGAPALVQRRREDYLRNRDRKLATARAYQIHHGDRIRARVRERRLRNGDRIRTQQREYYQRTRERQLANARARYQPKGARGRGQSNTRQSKNRNMKECKNTLEQEPIEDDDDDDDYPPIKVEEIEDEFKHIMLQIDEYDNAKHIGPWVDEPARRIEEGGEILSRAE